MPYYKNGAMPDRVLQIYRRNPEKYARNAVRVAVDNGTLAKPDRCERADRTCRGRIEAHHWSYDVEHWLDVKWLCISHHRRIHQEPAARVELATARLRIGCSTTELSRRKHTSHTTGNQTAINSAKPFTMQPVNDDATAA